MAGRRTKYTPERVDEIIASLKIGLTDRDAALASGISWDTFDAWQKRYPDFSDRVTRAKAERARTWLLMLRQNAQKGDTKAITELLDRCAPEYRKSSDLNVTHTGVVTHNLRDLTQFTDEDIETLAAVAERAKPEPV